MSKNTYENSNEKVEKIEEVMAAAVDNQDPTNVSVVEEFDAFEYQRQRDEAGLGAASEGSETTVFTVPLNMQRYPGVPQPDGKVYDRYAVAFKTKRDNVEIPMRFFVIPPQPTTEMYNLARFVFEGSEKKPMEIVRTVTKTTANGKVNTNVSYSMRVSCKDDYGSVISCSFKPQSAGDRAVFLNLQNFLRARDMIK